MQLTYEYKYGAQARSDGYLSAHNVVHKVTTYDRRSAMRGIEHAAAAALDREHRV